MKKLFAAILCVVLCFTFCGCSKTEKKNEEAREALLKVLNKEQNFTVKSLVFDRTSEENLSKFFYNSVHSAMNAFSSEIYAFVDFDSDGVEELMVTGIGDRCSLILRYDDGVVYGYLLECVSFEHIGTDGSFLIKRYEQHSALTRISFDGVSFSTKSLAYADEEADIYQFDYKDAPKEEVMEYIANWDKNTPKVTLEAVK